METLARVSGDKLVVIVTHNYEQAAPYVTRKITMHDGKIIEDKKIRGNVEVSADDYLSSPAPASAYDPGADYYTDEEEDGGLAVSEVLCYDELTQCYTTRSLIDLSTLKEIRFSCVDRAVTRNADGAILGFDEWQTFVIAHCTANLNNVNV